MGLTHCFFKLRFKYCEKTKRDEKIFHLVKAMDSEHLTFVMQNRLFHMRSTHCFFKSKFKYCEKAKRNEKNLPLNESSGIETSHLCYGKASYFI